MDAFTFVLLTGLGWGMLHAFDPDHMAAVAGSAVGDTSHRAFPSFAGFALRWSLGHGVAILAIAILVVIFGMAVPVNFSRYAEHSVAFLLIALGTFALFRLFTHYRYTSSSDDIVDTSTNLSQRSAVGVGIIHGVAGSAPLLALIPLANIHHPLLALAYVACFSAGVFTAMTGLGSALNMSLRFCGQLSISYQWWIRSALALFSISVGLFLLF